MRWIAALSLSLSLATPALAAKSLLVDLSKSTVYAFEDGRLVRSLVVNPGAKDSPTRLGKYRITQKVRDGYRSNLVDIHNKPLRRGGLGAPMDFWMRLGGTGMGFHRSSLWRPNGNWGSHGCMRMSRAGARWLYDWTPMGASVTVVSGGTQLASAVKSSRTRTASKAKALRKPQIAKSAIRKPAKQLAKAKKPVPAAKPVQVAKKKPIPAAKPIPTPPVIVETVEEPVVETAGAVLEVKAGPTDEPEVAPITASKKEAVTAPSTQN